jgi:hypothetical protein
MAPGGNAGPTLDLQQNVAKLLASRSAPSCHPQADLTNSGTQVSLDHSARHLHGES